MLSPKKKQIPISYIPQKMPIMFTDKDKPCHLLNDFKEPVTGNDFLKSKDDPSKNFGFFEDVRSLLYRKNKTIYYVKAIEKKNIINPSYQMILNNIYKLNNDNLENKNINIFDFIVKLQTHWEDNEHLFLVFEAIKKFTLFENLLKNNSGQITEENLLTMFRQILEVVNFLHKNNIYGCNLYINSFIYDKRTQTLKLTDLGFSKIFKSSKNLNDSKLQNSFEFNDYCPPEFISKMNDSANLFEQDKFKNANYDIWQLGILFYKIATFGESPYDDAKDENLKECIVNKNINYSRLNKYSPKIVQIIDKMLQNAPSSRYSVELLLNLEPFKIRNKIPSLIINSKNEEKIITMNLLNSNKGMVKDVKIDMASLLDNMEAKKKDSKEINYDEEIERNMNENNIANKNKEILKKIKIQGNLVNDLNSMVNQEIYPEGSILPIFKNKFLNKFNNIDKNLVIDLSNKLSLLEKEYKKLDENKLAVYNITNYVNNNIKELNAIDNDNIDLLIKKFNNLQLSKIETNDLYEEMLRNKSEFAQEKFKALISNLIYEIKRLEIELEQENLNNEKLKKKIREMEKRNMDLQNECQEKVEFYEKKIELLEEVIFNGDNKNLNNEQNLKKNNDYIYQALSNSIKDFTEMNIKLKTGLKENLNKFKENKRFWLQDMIKAKDNFRNEMNHYFHKSLEPPRIYAFGKSDVKEYKNYNELNAKIEELNRRNKELNDLVVEQKGLIDYNYNLIKELKNNIKTKEESIEELRKLLNNKESSNNNK